MAAIAPVLQAVGAVVGAVGAIQAGNAAAAEANYRAQIADMNKRIAEDNARRTIERSQVEEVDQDMEARAFLGTQEAAQAASGLSLGGRSAILARKTAREIARRDTLNLRRAAELEAYSFKTDAANFGANANLARMEARNLRSAGRLNAFSSLISGAARVAGSFGQNSTPRAPTSFRSILT